MSDETTDRPAGQAPEMDDDDVEGHLMMRSAVPAEADATGHVVSRGAVPPEDDDVEGHALFRSPSSRGE
jgi:hypothetical protein